MLSCSGTGRSSDFHFLGDLITTACTSCPSSIWDGVQDIVLRQGEEVPLLDVDRLLDTGVVLHLDGVELTCLHFL